MIIHFLIFLIIILLLTIIYIFFIRKDKYIPPPIIEYLKEKLSAMEPNIMNLDIRESSKESYTNNKETIYICTRDPKTKLYYSDNTLIYVLLHELAHMKDHKYNPHHDERFKDILEGLLLKAESYGLYNPNQRIPEDYCGLS